MEGEGRKEGRENERRESSGKEKEERLREG
jgi:hypothetical protein